MGIGGTLRFAQVWSHHRRLEIGEADDLLRVDDNHLLTALAQPNKRADDLVADRAVAVIGDDDSVTPRVDVGDAPYQQGPAALAHLFGIAFIEAHDVLSIGDDP